MKPHLGWSTLWVLGACGEPAPPELPGHPCASEVARVEVAPPEGDYGQTADGDDLWCGNPPQGGAPFTPFRLRVRGPEAFEDGAEIEMSAVDLSTGAEIAYTALTLGLTCANVGDSAGTWVGSEAHMRYAGAVLEDLDGVEAEISVLVRALGDEPIEAEERWTVTLVTSVESGG